MRETGFTMKSISFLGFVRMFITAHSMNFVKEFLIIGS